MFESEQAAREGRRTQKTQHGIETANSSRRTANFAVAELRKPSTGLKQCEEFGAGLLRRLVAELRKPSTGLKHVVVAVDDGDPSGRRTQKTQHGIETRRTGPPSRVARRSQDSENPARD